MTTPAMHTLILGLGETGLAAARWCLRGGDSLRVVDTRAEPPELAALRDGLDEAAAVEFFLGAAAFGAAPSPARRAGEGTSHMLNVALLDHIDRIVLSPGLIPTQPPVAGLLAAARAREIPVISEIDLFAQALAELRATQDYAPRVLAVTGTNGKTTVTALTRHLLAAAGVNARAAGNISPAATAALAAALDAQDLPAVWVLELSSFQLATVTALAPDAAVVLNISQDHLDWHGDTAAYAAAKARLFDRSRVRIVNRDDPVVAAMVQQLSDPTVRSFGRAAPLLAGDTGFESDHGVLWLAAGEAAALDEPTRAPRRKKAQAEEHPSRAPARVLRMMPSDALKLRGLHNALNAQAALLLAREVGLPWHALLPALADYAGEPQRMAFVRSVAGVDFIDDSKGTNVGATVAALQGSGAGKSAPVVLIAGGLGKGQDFAPLAQAARQHARAVVLIGQDAPVIAQALADEGVAYEHADTLEAAVARALALAEPGDAVLLSPACASMDMFRNYVHRSAAFVAAVNALALESGEVV